MTTPENEQGGKLEEERPRGLTPAKDQPSVLIEDEENRHWAKICAGAMVWNLETDDGTVALVEAALLPKGSAAPPWLDDTGMKLIRLLKERADEYIQAQRKTRAAKKSRPARNGLKLVQGEV
ncbi:hypothetical protein [Herminiimonas sp. CN]|uniref:hypothetical protein n=1 Tax=Herminiimonas sp. CN TaxID=1349818 RepID=UPI0004734A9E|nr:hypothetical protein [Herminiimonas sp. CN]